MTRFRLAGHVSVLLTPLIWLAPVAPAADPAPAINETVETLSTLPPGITSKGAHGPACTVSPDGRHFAIAIAPNVIVD